jgi:hypothetical protein
MTNPVDAILGELRTALQFVAPIADHSRELSAHTSPPRYVWTDVGGPWKGARMAARNPRPIAMLPWQVFVDCWGADRDQAWDLMRALGSAVRTSVCGRNYRVLGTKPTPKEHWLTCGYSWRVTLELQVAVIEPLLPTVAQAEPAPGDPPATLVTNNLRPTVVIEAVDEDTPAESVAGDGVLEGTET